MMIQKERDHIKQRVISIGEQRKDLRIKLGIEFIFLLQCCENNNIEITRIQYGKGIIIVSERIKINIHTNQSIDIIEDCGKQHLGISLEEASNICFQVGNFR